MYFAFASNPASEYSIANRGQQVKKKHIFTGIIQVRKNPYLRSEKVEGRREKAVSAASKQFGIPISKFEVTLFIGHCVLLLLKF